MRAGGDEGLKVSVVCLVPWAHPDDLRGETGRLWGTPGYKGNSRVCFSVPFILSLHLSCSCKPLHALLQRLSSFVSVRHEAAEHQPRIKPEPGETVTSEL